MDVNLLAMKKKTAFSTLYRLRGIAQKEVELLHVVRWIIAVDVYSDRCRAETVSYSTTSKYYICQVCDIVPGLYNKKVNLMSYEIDHKGY